MTIDGLSGHAATIHQIVNLKRRKMYADQYTSQTVIPAAPLKLQHSREEAAEMIGVSLRTLDRLVAEKRLPIRRIGRRVLINHDVLLRFVQRDHPTAVIQ
jgi:excisionase family DNA binding protein